MGRIPIAKIPVPAFKEDKWVTLSNDNLSLMQLLDVDIDFLTSSKKEDSNFDNILRAGGIYALGRDKVEGVEFDNIYFKVYSIVNEYKGVNLDSVIVKEVSIDENGNVIENTNPTKRRKFSIPPSMCKMLGIEYSPGFELWPIKSGFVRVNIDDFVEKEEKDIVYSNLSTYPVSEIDGTIRKMILIQ